MWNQEPSVLQVSSVHHSDEVYDHEEEETLHPEDKNMCQKETETEAHDRWVSSVLDKI